jgi:hypothetical protein
VVLDYNALPFDRRTLNYLTATLSTI